MLNEQLIGYDWAVNFDTYELASEMGIEFKGTGWYVNVILHPDGSTHQEWAFIQKSGEDRFRVTVWDAGDPREMFRAAAVAEVQKITTVVKPVKAPVAVGHEGKIMCEE